MQKKTGRKMQITRKKWGHSLPKPAIIEMQLLFNDDHILTVPGKTFWSG